MRPTKPIAIVCVLLGLVACGSEAPMRPPVDDGVIETHDEFVDALAASYRTRDYERFVDLIAEPFRFTSVAPPPGGRIEWGRAEALVLHRRMFNPDATPAGEPPVPDALVLDSIDIQLSRESDWVERTDLYARSQNPGGFDPLRWRVVDARYRTFALFDTQSETDYLVEGYAQFVVLEDLTKSGQAAKRFLLHHWDDLDGSFVKPRPVHTPF